MTKQQAFLQANIKRQQVIKLIREFFDGRGFQELVIPVLNKSMPMFPSVFPFRTTWEKGSSEQELFLPIFPERTMKKYLAAGAEKPYTIGHCFRGLEDCSPTHHPEFLMLEWYRTDSDYRQIMRETQELIEFVIHNTDKGSAGHRKKWTELSIEKLWQERFDMSMKEILTWPKVVKLAEKLGYQTQGATWEQLFHQIYLNEIESQFPEEPFFLGDFPALLSPLCKPQADKPWLAERFEVYIHKIEIGNGNSEQVDVGAVRKYFQEENRIWRAQGRGNPPLDEDFLGWLGAMQNSGKKFAGMGLGVDRLAMAVMGIEKMELLWQF